ncbi:MAG: 1-acyl-sn-glycerol-3-phosphate acyltransferase [Paracoccaceae bacterium]
MWETIEVPVWAVWLVAVLAIVGLLDRVITPSLRWVFQRRVTRAIDKLNERLQVQIQPFKLTRRQVLIDRLVHDPAVLSEMDDHMAETGKPLEVVKAEVERYAREIVPAFSAYAYFAVGARVSRWIAQALYRVRLGAFDESALTRVDPQATVIFVMNHRSNVDYLLVTYLASTQSALSYAVGEWARVWPLSRIIRAMGAYFIRRRSRDGLYREDLARYVRMATDAGVTQAIFPEGGLSRDGRLAPPKLGLLSYIVDGFDAEVRDVVFVPVGLNYDRVLEDRLLLTSDGAPGDAARFRVSGWTAVGYVARLAWLRLTGRLYRFGYACVSFGAPLSLAEFMAGAPTDPVAELGSELSQRIGAVVPVLPVSLISRVLISRQDAMSVIDLKVRAAEELVHLHDLGAHSHIPRTDLDYAVEVGLRMLLLRRVVVETPDGIMVPPTEMPVLTYYANAIAHLGGVPQDRMREGGQASISSKKVP